MRLIDADTLKDKARELIPNYHASVVMNLFDLIDNLADNMPTIEALRGRKAGEWIPIKTRKMDEEERAEWSEKFGYDIEYEYAVVFDCPMPEDGQEILVSYRKWILMDKCEIAYGGLYGLEGNDSWEGVLAWMPAPEPWKGEEP